ncbi:MAG: hypothetical protein ETSY1_37190 [Candidatus Entotheonella factor]|uniref:PA14 domain-containing protein n=1 Tax=Entotheonella factor TaxID=1429438 RepID=W4L7M5_ENTF1|nr:MAG: hypothetical protein ETSY1_37190 [Candidatus Entotheonella factor]
MRTIIRRTGVGLFMIVQLLVGNTDIYAQPETIELNGVIRDFRESHIDFEGNENTSGEIIPNIVLPFLDRDKRPIYNNEMIHHTTNGQESFDEWFRHVPGVNLSDSYRMVFERTGESTFRFLREAFFPIDGQLFGNEEHEHNFHFTLEVQGRFTYRGDDNEFIIATADDDLWGFINGQLAIDIGGRHRPVTQRIDLDEDMANVLGLVPGIEYDFAFFFAERHTHGSYLDIETSIVLENGNCILIPPEGEVRSSCVGTSGNDTIIGTNQDDVIFGLGGRDTLIGNDGDDVIFGGRGPDDISGGPGSDLLFGEDGNDRVSSFGLTERPVPQGKNQGQPLTCTHQNGDDLLEDNLWGGPGSDVLCGDDSVDFMYGEEGDDTLRGEGGLTKCSAALVSMCWMPDAMASPTFSTAERDTKRILVTFGVMILSSLARR